MHPFERLFMGAPRSVTVAEQMADALHLLASVKAEEFDRSLPGSWTRHGEWFPRQDVMHLAREQARLLRAQANRAMDMLGLRVRDARPGERLRYPNHDAESAALKAYEMAEWWPDLWRVWRAAER